MSTRNPINREAPPTLLLSTSQKNHFHPALTVTNIKNHIPVVLEMENSQLGMWVEIFKIHVHSDKVIHHTIPPTLGKEKNKTSKSDDENM